MTVLEAAKALDLAVCCPGDPGRQVETGYAGDLLSWVMGRAPAGCLWFTVMSSVNVAAVCLLADAAAVCLTEGALPDAALQAKAEREGIALLRSEKSAYQLCGALHDLLKE